jgi:hypothetical protein
MLNDSMRILLTSLSISISLAAAANGPAKFDARRDYHGPSNGGARLLRVADGNGDQIPDIVEIAYGPRALTVSAAWAHISTMATARSH